MSWWVWVLAITGLAFAVWCLRATFAEEREALLGQQKRHSTEMFRIACEERKRLEEYAKSLVGYVPGPRPHEVSWCYLTRLAMEGYLPCAKPWQPSWGAYMSRNRFEVWTTVYGGVRHRVAKLQLMDGTQVPTLLCSVSTSVDTTVCVHELVHCPVVTCLTCVTLVRD